ncbi:MAG: Uma2 family endonuclease [Candidatus Competibacteraceae bacterium]|nr:Uma2 family endonuclease [Candidatus Competibacteraceae bacterium]
MNAVLDWLPRHRLTVADYHRMGMTGVLAEDAHVELIEGEIFDMAPIGSLHAGTVSYLSRLWVRAIGDRAIVWIQNPVALDQCSEPEPDVALLRPRADFYKTRHPQASDVLLIIEVADSSLRYDREVKLPLYARHGIAEVWIVDLVLNVVDVHRQPQADRYRESLRLSPPIRLAPLAFPDLDLDLRDLF